MKTWSLFVSTAGVLCILTSGCAEAQKLGTKRAEASSEKAEKTTPLPEKPAPQGMKLVPVNGPGRVLVSHMSGTPSSKKMAQAVTIVLGEYFDAKPVYAAAFVNPADTDLQATFIARLSGKPVRGVMTIGTRGNEADVVVIFDRPTSIVKSFPTLMAALEGKASGGSGVSGGGAAAPAQARPEPVHLTPTQLPDGSGQVGLPPGFRIVGAYKGTTDIVGPNQEVMALGAVAAVSPKQLGAFNPNITPVDFSDPAKAAMDYMNFNARKAGVDLKLEVIDVKYIPFNGTRAAMIRYRGKVAGKSNEGFGLFSVKATDVNMGILYFSFLTAPSGIFEKSFNAMFRSWMSWGVSSTTLTNRVLEAAQTMKESGEILTGANASRQETYGRVNKAWSQYIRDTASYVGPDGRFNDLPNTYASIMTANGYTPVTISGQ